MVVLKNVLRGIRNDVGNVDQTLIKENREMIKTLLAAVMLACFATTTAYAAGGSMTPQQRMKECGPKTKGMTKEQRSAFMKQCLSKAGHEAAMAGKGGASAAASTSKAKAMKKSKKATPKAKPSSKRAAQQMKMKTCNADAKIKKLKGKDRKAFMSSCLKGS